MPTFIGTSSGDQIDGSVDPDELIGLEGDDFLYGHGSGDELFGDEGNDQLAGGAGSDTLEGGAGEDTLFGGTGDDSAEGGADNDLIYGGTGDDILNGGDGADTIGNDWTGANLITNGSFEDGTHSANGVNGLTGWSDTSGSPDSADDNTPAENWNPAHFGTDGTGYATMWATTNGTQEAMQQTLATPLSAGTTYTVQMDALSADYVGGQWFTPSNIPVTFEILDQSTMTVLGSVTVQSTDYETYSFEITPITDVSTIVIRPAGDGQGQNPSLVIDDLVMVEGTGPFGEDGEDTIDAGAGDDLVHAGDGNDQITAGDGADEIHGGAGDDLILADEGSTGADTILGGGGADTIHADGSDSVDGGAGGTDADVLDLTGSTLAGGSQNIVITGTDSNGNGFDGYVEYYDAGAVLQHTLQFSEIETIIPCFTPGTRIKTIRGEVAVEHLAIGDRVMTKDNGYQPLAWIGTRSLWGEETRDRPEFRPVRIAKGALGDGLPERDMLVSPQHRMLVHHPRADLLFGEGEVLIAAKHLTVLDGVDIAGPMPVDYIHVMCAAHEIVSADGCWTESFQPNDRTLGGFDASLREELFALFPKLALPEITQHYAAARPALKRFEAAALLA